MPTPTRKVKVAIIGAGSGGLSAFGEVRKHTDDLVVINAGPHGTTCARVGCMPSKVLIQAANDFHRRKKFEAEGIYGADKLTIDPDETMKFVRSLRDRFVRGVMGTVEAIGDRNIDGFATFVAPNQLQVNDEIIEAEKIIIASGTRPIILDEWKQFGDRIITSDQIFEQETIPKTMAVFGTGVIGLELGQALKRIGLDVHHFGRQRGSCGLTDPDIKAYAVKVFEDELDLTFSTNYKYSEGSNGKIRIEAEGQTWEVEKILSAIGRRLNTDRLGLEKIGVELDENGLPPFNRNTMQVADLPIYIAGDITFERTLLHEASDEGKIAGYNAVRPENTPFKRRVPLGITFTDPDIAMVGQTYRELTESGVNFQTGEVTFEGQGRSIVMQKECGLLHVYGDSKTGKLLGAEMMGPKNEHIAHLLAWCMQQELTVFDVLKFPFYHPVVEEGLRTALRDLLHKVDSSRYFELNPL